MKFNYRGGTVYLEFGSHGNISGSLHWARANMKHDVLSTADSNGVDEDSYKLYNGLVTR